MIVGIAVDGRCRTRRLRLGDRGLERQHRIGALSRAIESRERQQLRDVRLVSIALFDGAGREARMRQKDAVMHESEERTRDLAQQVSAEVQAALIDVDSGREQEAIARERVGLALQQLEEARIRFRSGVASNIDLIEAQSALVRARDAEIGARAATATARIHLARAAGVAESLRSP